MASIIKIKRSSGSLQPTTLAEGELAYSFGAGIQSNGGDRLYFGNGTTVDVIGGRYFTKMLAHAPGTLAGSSAIIVDENLKVNNFKVDNLDIDGNTISSTNTNGNVVLSPNGVGTVDVSNSRIVNVATPTGTGDAVNKQYVDTLVTESLPSNVLTISGDSGSVGMNIDSDNLQIIAGANGLTTSITRAGADVSVALSLSQDIQTTASPVFAGMTLAGDLVVNGGDLVTNVLTFNLVNTTATTVNFAGEAGIVNIGAATSNVVIADDASVGGDLTITGNLTVNGTTTTTDVVNSVVADPLLNLASGNNSNILDIGFFGQYDTDQFTGLFRDASDSNKYKLFATGTVTDNSVSVGTLADLVVGTLDAVIDGGTY